MKAARIFPLNEQAITVEFDEFINEEANEKAIAAWHYLKANPFPGFIESLPAYSSFTVYYDPLVVKRSLPYDNEPVYRIVTSHLQSILPVLGNALIPSGEEINIPVCYSPECGPDLEEVARFCSLTVDEVIRLHSSQLYKVHFIGFIPGFPYLAVNPDGLDVPRKKTPALSVASGSVGIAGLQSGIYPFAVPGGWQIIGRTPLTIFDKTATPCSLLQPGMRVRFIPVSYNKFNTLLKP